MRDNNESRSFRESNERFDPSRISPENNRYWTVASVGLTVLAWVVVPVCWGMEAIGFQRGVQIVGNGLARAQHALIETLISFETNDDNRSRGRMAMLNSIGGFNSEHVVEVHRAEPVAVFEEAVGPSLSALSLVDQSRLNDEEAINMAGAAEIMSRNVRQVEPRLNDQQGADFPVYQQSTQLEPETESPFDFEPVVYK